MAPSPDSVSWFSLCTVGLGSATVSKETMDFKCHFPVTSGYNNLLSAIREEALTVMVKRVLELECV